MQDIINTIETFRKWSDEAKVESDRFKDEGDSYRSALQFGVHTAYKVAAEHLAFTVEYSAQKAKEVSLPYGRPAFLNQPAPSQSIEEMEAEGRVHSGTSRPNPHE